jgi:DNA invertase Pin-like site-specific DNA recombinase
MSKRIAIYARVSTKHKGQEVETQLQPLREYVRNRGFTVQDEYVDVGVTGTRDRRPHLDRLMKAAQSRQFDAVVVFRFDRFARSIKHLVIALEQFQSLGVDFISLNEAVDTSTPMGKAMFTVIGAMSELESNIIRERVAAGMKRAKREGIHCGRPARIFNKDKAREMAGKGMSLRVIAKALGVGKDTVRAAL